MQALTQAKDAAAKVLHRNKSLEDRIAKRLDGAGSSWKPSEWLLLHSAIFVGLRRWWASCSARAACSSA